MTITGTSLARTTGASFNSTAASFTRISATRVDAIVPPGASTGPIRVTTPEGTTASAAVFTANF